MASNVFKGRQAFLGVYATSSGSTAAAEIGAVRNYSVELTRGEIDVGNFDSSGWTIRLDGIASWGMNCETVFLSTAATHEQDTLRAAALAGTRKYWRLKNSTGTDSQQFHGWGYVSGFTWNGAVDGPQLHNFSIVGDGKLTEAT